ENEPVSAGAPLLVLEDEGPQAVVEEARAAVDAAQTHLDQVRKAPERHRLRLAGQRAALEAVRSRLSAARHILARKQDMKRTNLADAEEVAAAEDSVRELEAQQVVESRRLDELGLEQPELEVRRAEEELARAKARLRQAEQVLNECTLKAPQSG